MNLQPILEHTNIVTTAVHDELIRWSQGLLRQAGLESVDVWGRFPPEGTVRSHLVLFPYRVGPEPKSLENSRGASIMVRKALPSDKVARVPTPWRDLGKQLVEASHGLFPPVTVDRPQTRKRFPFPTLSELPSALADWYASQDTQAEDPWTMTHDGELYARAPSLSWFPGVSLFAHYIAVAGDPGRGVSDRTSDAPPLSLGALSTLTVGIQHERILNVELPAMPAPPELMGFVEAMRSALISHDDEDLRALGERMAETIVALSATEAYQFGIVPVHDLSMHEFALLTQALQRPLQAVLNFRIAFQLGATPVFAPGTVVSLPMPQGKERGSSR